jgi:hypothetical protein
MDLLLKGLGILILWCGFSVILLGELLMMLFVMFLMGFMFMLKLLGAHVVGLHLNSIDNLGFGHSAEESGDDKDL